MNQQEVMHKVKELARLISESKHPANTLEIAVLKNKCVDLYEHIQILVPGFAEDVAQPVVEEIKPLIEEQINAPQPLQEIIAETIEALKMDPPSLFESTPVIPEPIAPPAPELTSVPEPEMPLHHPEPERTSRDEVLLHEQLSKSSPKNDINAKLQAKVESLKTAISLNKKIAFVNHLFKENTVEYAKAIDKLNMASTMEESMLYFAELKHNYNWENDDDLVKELKELIEKRFS